MRSPDTGLLNNASYLSGIPVKIHPQRAQACGRTLAQAPAYIIWAYRKAAWPVDELKESLLDIDRKQEKKGLEQLPDIGKILYRTMIPWLTREEINGGEPHGH